MPPVVVKSYYLRVVEALTKCNFIAVNDVQVKRTSKADTHITLFCEDSDTGEEFPASFDTTTPLAILDNTVGFECKEGYEVTVRFFTQSKFFP